MKSLNPTNNVRRNESNLMLVSFTRLFLLQYLNKFETTSGYDDGFFMNDKRGSCRLNTRVYSKSRGDGKLTKDSICRFKLLFSDDKSQLKSDSSFNLICFAVISV